MRHLFVTVLIIFILIAINYAGGNFLREIVLSTLKEPSLFLTEKFFELRAFTVSLFNYSLILEENKNLSLKNFELLAERDRLAAVEEKYDQLKKQLSSANPRLAKLEPVRIFLFSYGPKRAGAFIDKGEESGITKGQAVIYGGNILIGVIEEVFSEQARIMLITDPSFRVNVRASNGVQALARGAMRKRLSLDFIAAEDDIKEGNFLFTNGMDGLPESLLIGEIEKIESSGGDLFKKVFVKPAFEKIKSIHAFVIIQ